METSYQKIIRCGNDKLKKDVRKEIAIYAHDHGITKTVEDYHIAKNTARKWRDRYRRGEPMTDRSRKPERQPNQIALYWRCLIIDKAQDRDRATAGATGKQNQTDRYFRFLATEGIPHSLQSENDS